MRIYLAEITASLGATSTTSLTIGTGSKTLTTQTGLEFEVGQYVTVQSSASTTNTMFGVITAYNSGTGSMTVLVTSVTGSGTIASWNVLSRFFFCSGNGYVTGPAETPPNLFYEPKIKQPAVLKRDMFSTGTTGGESSIGYGEMLLSNIDGGLDYLVDYGFDGRPITIRVGEDDAAYPGGFTTVFVGTMDQPALEFKQVSIRLRDRQAELSAKPLQPTKYAGNNSLPSGLEGMATDLLGKPKPKLWGTVTNVPPSCVNTSRLIYQVNDGAISSISNVYDRGAALTKGADYTSQADMETTAPAASNFRVWPAGGYFRLGSSPAGLITADVTGDTAGNSTVAQIAKAIVVNQGGLGTADYSSSDVTTLDTANSSVIGVYVDGETTINTVLDEVCNSVGAWWGFDALGVFRIKRLVAPTGSPVATFTDTEILDIERISKSNTRAGGSSSTGGVPNFKVNLSFAKNYSVQDTDLAGSVTDARRAVLKEEFATVNSTDTSVKTKHLLSPELNVSTLLTVAANAQTESDRLLAMFKVRRDFLSLKVRVDTATISVLDIGEVVTVETARFGYSAGKLFRIIGITTDLRLNKVELTLWG